MSGVKGKSGRKRKSKNRADGQRSMTKALPNAIETILQTCDGVISDRLRFEAACRIEDRVLGKPKQQTDLNIQDAENLGAGTVLLMMELFHKARQDAIETHQDAITGNVEVKQIEEGIDATE